MFIVEEMCPNLRKTVHREFPRLLINHNTSANQKLLLDMIITMVAILMQHSTGAWGVAVSFKNSRAEPAQRLYPEKDKHCFQLIIALFASVYIVWIVCST